MRWIRNASVAAAAVAATLVMTACGGGRTAAASTFAGDEVWRQDWLAAAGLADSHLVPPPIDSGVAYAETGGPWADDAGLPRGIPIVGGMNDGVGSIVGAALGAPPTLRPYRDNGTIFPFGEQLDGRYREVKPDTVLEIAFDSIQPSTRHESGLALRFPRIKGIRRDKTAAEIDTLAYARSLMNERVAG